MAETPPRVSVIVRTRHRPDALRRALEDIGRQDFTDLEVVVVDDTDDPAPSEAIVAALPDHPPIRLVPRIGEPHGRWAAANAGIAASAGGYLVLHDDDDSWDPGFLSATVSHLDAGPERVAVASRVEVVFEEVDDAGAARSRIEAFCPELEGIALADILRANVVPPISLLYRRSLHDELGLYDAAFPVLQDWVFLLRVLSRHRVDLLDPPALARWHHRPGATGDAANSFADGEHARVAAELLDRELRTTVAREGWGAVQHTAAESERLGRRIGDEARGLHAALGGLAGRLDALDAALDALRAGQEDVRTAQRRQEARLGRLEAALGALTPGAILRGLARRLRPRRRR